MGPVAESYYCCLNNHILPDGIPPSRLMTRCMLTAEYFFSLDLTEVVTS